MKIKTSKNKYFIIDRDDYDKISEYSWWIAGNGYVYTEKRINKKRIVMRLHRLIMHFPDCDIDHINHNKLDNRKSNLRLCNMRENQRNCIKRQHDKSTSKYKGVGLFKWSNRKKPWRVRINTGTEVIVKYCLTEIEAATQYNKLAKKYFGEFAYLNKLEDR